MPASLRTQNIWMAIKDEYDDTTREKLQAIETFFSPTEAPVVANMQKLANASLLFNQCVHNLYQQLPETAQTVGNKLPPVTPQRVEQLVFAA